MTKLNFKRISKTNFNFLNEQYTAFEININTETPLKQSSEIIYIGFYSSQQTLIYNKNVLIKLII